MYDALLALYITNAVLLINHELDSVHWKEWEMFRIPGGVTVFLLLHFPLLGAVLAGVALVARAAPAGLWFSLALGAGGIFAFGIHTFFIRRGHPGFRAPVSQFMLWGTLAVSVAQLALTARILLPPG